MNPSNSNNRSSLNQTNAQFNPNEPNMNPSNPNFQSNLNNLSNPNKNPRANLIWNSLSDNPRPRPNRPKNINQPVPSQQPSSSIQLPPQTSLPNQFYQPISSQRSASSIQLLSQSNLPNQFYQPISSQQSNVCQQPSSYIQLPPQSSLANQFYQPISSQQTASNIQLPSQTSLPNQFYQPISSQRSASSIQILSQTSLPNQFYQPISSQQSNVCHQTASNIQPPQSSLLNQFCQPISSQQTASNIQLPSQTSLPNQFYQPISSQQTASNIQLSSQTSLPNQFYQPISSQQSNVCHQPASNIQPQNNPTNTINQSVPTQRSDLYYQASLNRPPIQADQINQIRHFSYQQTPDQLSKASYIPVRAPDENIEFPLNFEPITCYQLVPNDMIDPNDLLVELVQNHPPLPSVLDDRPDERPDNALNLHRLRDYMLMGRGPVSKGEPLPYGFKSLLPLLYGKLSFKSLKTSPQTHDFLRKWIASLEILAIEFDALHILVGKEDTTEIQTNEERERDLLLSELIFFVMTKQVDPDCFKLNSKCSIYENISNLLKQFNFNYVFEEHVYGELTKKYMLLAEEKQKTERDIEDQQNINYARASQLQHYGVSQFPLLTPTPEWVQKKKPSPKLLRRSIDVFKECLGRFLGREFSLHTGLSAMEDEMHWRFLRATISYKCSKHFLVAYLDTFHNGLLAEPNKYPLVCLPTTKTDNNESRPTTNKPIRLSFDLIKLSWNEYAKDNTSLLIHNRASSTDDDNLNQRIDVSFQMISKLEKQAKSKKMSAVFKTLFYVKDAIDNLFEVLKDQIEFNKLFFNLPSSIKAQIIHYLKVKEDEFQANNKIYDEKNHDKLNKPFKSDPLLELLLLLWRESIVIFNFSIACLHAVPAWIPLFDEFGFLAQRNYCRCLIDHLCDLYPAVITYSDLNELEKTRLHPLDYVIDIESQLDYFQQEDMNKFVKECLKTFKMFTPTNNVGKFLKMFEQHLNKLAHENPNSNVLCFNMNYSYIMPYVQANLKYVPKVNFDAEVSAVEDPEEWKKQMEPNYLRQILLYQLTVVMFEKFPFLKQAGVDAFKRICTFAKLPSGYMPPPDLIVVAPSSYHSVPDQYSRRLGMSSGSQRSGQLLSQEVMEQLSQYSNQLLNQQPGRPQDQYLNQQSIELQSRRQSEQQYGKIM